jgi:hypothetical protein
MPARPLGGRAPAALWPLASRNLGIAAGVAVCWPAMAAGKPVVNLAVQNKLLDMCQLMQRLERAPALRWGVTGGGLPG